MKRLDRSSPKAHDNRHPSNKGFGLSTKTLTPPTQETPYYVKALAMALPAVMLGLQITGWIFFLPGAIKGHCDFRHLYTAGYMVRTGHRRELYDYSAEQKFQNNLVSQESIALPFNHLAYESLIFVPYSFLSYRSAYFLFLATNVLLLGLAMRWMAPRTNNLRRIFLWLPAAIFVTFLPVVAALMQGQDSIILLLLISGALALLSSGRMLSAGVLVGLGLFKFQIVVPLALLFLLWRRWRFVGGFALSAAAVVAVSAYLVGTVQMTVYAHSLLSMSVLETAIDQAKFNINPIMMPNLRGIISATFGRFVPLAWTQVLTGIASLAALLWIAITGIRRESSRQFMLAVSAGALLSYHLIIHDLSILSIPLVVILGSCTSSSQLDSAAAAVSALMFSAPAVIALTPARPYLVGLPVLLFVAVLSVGGSRPPLKNVRSGLEECI